MAGITADSNGGRALYQTIGLILGPILFFAVLFTSTPEGMSDAAWKTVAVAALMASWWATEAIPVPATSLIPLVLLPVLDITSSKEASWPYAEPVIFLLLGGFIAAMGMQRWQLHRRIALNILARVGDHPAALIAGFMAASALLSMWISNTATTLMIVPIAITVADTILREKASGHKFTIALLIGCAWAASIGGLGTYIGTPPNLFVKGFILQETGRDIQFLEWMLSPFRWYSQWCRWRGLCSPKSASRSRQTWYAAGRTLCRRSLRRWAPSQRRNGVLPSSWASWHCCGPSANGWWNLRR